MTNKYKFQTEIYGKKIPYKNLEFSLGSMYLVSSDDKEKNLFSKGIAYFKNGELQGLRFLDKEINDLELFMKTQEFENLYYDICEILETSEKIYSMKKS